jgi:YidC/Oxa1 family membrane protein insertase
METQGKRLLLAVGLALAVMMVFQLIWRPKDADKKKQDGSGSAQVTQPVAGQLPAPAPKIATTPEAPRGPEEKIVLEFPKLKATFSSYGGALVSWQLLDEKYKKDPTTQHKGEILPGRAGTGAFFVDFPRSDIAMPANVEWQGTRVSDTQVKYTVTAKPFVIEKDFVIDPDAYAVKMNIKVTLDLPAGQVARQSLAVSAFAFQDPKADLSGSQRVAARIWSSASLPVDGDLADSNIKDLIESPRYSPDVKWAGFEHPYLMQAYSPRRAPNEIIAKYSYAIGGDGVMRSDLIFPLTAVKSGESIQREITAYLGPKAYKPLGAADAFAGYDAGFSHTIDFGWFGVIGKPLLWLLLKFYAVVGNWGLAIMILTFLVKLATIYWTTKSMRSMKAMAALAPQMKGLQEKYKDDRQRLQAETMALYKTHNVNPVAGCLPIFLQMPIWIALYRMLSNAGELYQQPFISGWIDDLTRPDPYHILPVVLLVTMFAQARMTPSTGTGGQQKFLQYGMPLMFGVMSFFFPSGLTIYIFTNTVLSAIHSIYMNKFDKKSLAIMAKMKAQQEEAAAKAEAAKVVKSSSTDDSTGAPKGPRKKKKKKR